MDIHPQFGEIRTVKDFLVRLLLIVLGVLVAVTVTQWNEQRSRNALAAEMRTRLVDEIAVNVKSLALVTDVYAATAAELDRVAKACASLNPQGRADVALVNLAQEVKLDLRTPVVAATQWHVASSNQSLRDFSNQDASAFSRIYTQQQFFESVLLQHKPGTLAALVDASLLQADASPEQTRASCRAFVQLRLYVASTLGNMRGLSATYASAPSKSPVP